MTGAISALIEKVDEAPEEVIDEVILEAIWRVDADNAAPFFAIPAIARQCFAEAVFAYRWLEGSRLDRIDQTIDALMASRARTGERENA